MTKEREALKLALEALDGLSEPYDVLKAQEAIREALAQPAQQEGCQCPACQVLPHASDCAVHNGPAYPKGKCDCGVQQEPEFFAHSVDQPYDWSEWVCPDPKGYLMKCCDCGLVHEAEFGVVRYKSETEREDCDRVDDPNLQAVFRMRRSEQWSPKDTAYRPGGLAQPEQEPVAWLHTKIEGVAVPHRPADLDKHPDRWEALYKTPPPCPTCEALARTVMLDQTSHDATPPQTEPVIDKSAAVRIATALGWEPKRTWQGLTDEDMKDALVSVDAETKRLPPGFRDFARAIEAKLKEKNNG